MGDERKLEVYVAKNGDIRLAGDSFSVGEFEMIGSRMINWVKAQPIVLGRKEKAPAKKEEGKEPSKG